MKHFKTTVIGGIVFLVPFVILVLLLGKVFGFMLLIADPLGDFLTLEGVADVIIVNLVAATLLLVAFHLAGLLAESAPMPRLFRALDRRLSRLIPGYAYVRSIFKDLDPGATSAFKPVVVRLNDMRQLGFWVEDIDDVDCVVYLPVAPEPRSGIVAIVEKSRVTELDSSFIDTVDILNRLGGGSGARLKSLKGE
jgi:uncharacterized membrane protein